MIRKLDYSLDVSEAQKQLDNPEVWNRHDERRLAYAHRGVDDIWVRFRDLETWDGDLATLTNEHESVWYPVVHKLPAVWSLVRRVCRRGRASKLGGVLITRIPPGGRVEPHIDHGWHARAYEKVAVQIKGDKRQAFCFEDGSLSAEDGEVYTFDNSKLHWVTNDSDRERISLIVCIKRD